VSAEVTAEAEWAALSLRAVRWLRLDGRSPNHSAQGPLHRSPSVKDPRSLGLLLYAVVFMGSPAEFTLPCGYNSRPGLRGLDGWPVVGAGGLIEDRTVAAVRIAGRPREKAALVRDFGG